MATKLENYVQMACQTAAEITENREKWTSFLDTASKLYRYQFTDQLLIHAQRPQATACAEFDLWNKRMKRYIRRGSKGIGLVSLRSGRPSLRYVFDISDTGKRQDAHELFQWIYKNEYDAAVTRHMEDYFGVQNKNGIVGLFGDVAVKCSKGFWKKYGGDVISSTAGSRLETLDNRSLCVKFCNLLAYSVCYMILIRCGTDSRKILSLDVFDSIVDFNTPAMTKILGYAVSRAGDLILHQIAIAVFQYEKEKMEEHRDRYEDLSREAKILLSKLTNIKKIPGVEKEEFERGEFDMCKAFEDMKEEAKIEGRAEGTIEGRAEGKAEERENGIRSALNIIKEFSGSREQGISALIKEYSLSRENAMEKVALYW